MGGPELARFLTERGAMPMDMSDFEGVALDADGTVVFPSAGTRGKQPAVRPRTAPRTKAEAVLPGGACDTREACVGAAMRVAP